MKRNIDNSIEFWDCPSYCNWGLYSIINKETKSFNPIPILLCKVSWDFSRKNKCDNILNTWKIYFQASDNKGHNFLGLCNDNMQTIIPLIDKGSLWLKYFGYLNLLCTRALKAIVNHIPIGEYQLRFFSKKKFECSCGSYMTESRWHMSELKTISANYFSFSFSFLFSFLLFFILET